MEKQGGVGVSAVTSSRLLKAVSEVILAGR